MWEVLIGKILSMGLSVGQGVSENLRKSAMVSASETGKENSEGYIHLQVDMHI